MRRHQMFLVASQVEHFKHGDETNVLLACECGCGRTEVKTLRGAWGVAAVARAFSADESNVRQVVVDG